MSIDCLGYQPSSQSPEYFDIKYRVDGQIVWVRVSREAVEDFYGISGGVAQKFEEHGEAICGQVGVWLARLESHAQLSTDRLLISSTVFSEVMAEVSQ